MSYAKRKKKTDLEVLAVNFGNLVPDLSEHSCLQYIMQKMWTLESTVDCVLWRSCHVKYLNKETSLENTSVVLVRWPLR